MLWMERNALDYGINTELKMTMDFAKLVLKIKKIMNQEFRKIPTLISCSSVMVYAKRQI